jgi:hypothetical protein
MLHRRRSKPATATLQTIWLLPESATNSWHTYYERCHRRIFPLATIPCTYTSGEDKHRLLKGEHTLIKNGPMNKTVP